VGLHAANAALIFGILRKLRFPGAWLAAALFCVHPVCSGTVAWIAEIKNTLSLFFALLTIWFLQRSAGGTSRQETRSRWGERDYSLALLSFLLALLSKISVAMLPFALAGLDYWLRRGKTRVESGQETTPKRTTSWITSETFRSLIRTAPFFVFSLVLGLISVWFQRHHAMTIVTESEYEPVTSRLLAGGYALWFYLWKAIVPLNLMPIYARWEINPSSVVDWIPGLLWLGLLWGCWQLSKVHSATAEGSGNRGYIVTWLHRYMGRRASEISSRPASKLDHCSAERESRNQTGPAKLNRGEEAPEKSSQDAMEVAYDEATWSWRQTGRVVFGD